MYMVKPGKGDGLKAQEKKRKKGAMYLRYTRMGLKMDQGWYGYEYGDELKVTKYGSAWRAVF